MKPNVVRAITENAWFKFTKEGKVIAVVAEEIHLHNANERLDYLNRFVKEGCELKQISLAEYQYYLSRWYK